MNNSDHNTYDVPNSAMPQTPSLRYDSLEHKARQLKRSANGWLFTGADEEAEARGWWIFFIVATAAATIFMMWLWISIFLPLIRFKGFGLGDMVFAAITVAAMWGLFVGLDWSKRRYDRIKIFEPARVMLLSNGYGANAAIPVIFRRNLKNATLPEPAEIFARLSCFELIERDLGTTTEYSQELVWQSRPAAAFVSKGKTRIDADLELHTPTDPMYSTYRQDFSSNKKTNISWVIEVYQSVGKFKSHLIIPIKIREISQTQD